jgi:cytochrome c-type biogenesis protein CcsB
MGLYHDTPTDFLINLQSIQFSIWPNSFYQTPLVFDSNLYINSLNDSKVLSTPFGVYSAACFYFLKMPILAINNFGFLSPEASNFSPTKSELSTFFANGSFLLLFLTLAFYWFELAFFDFFTIKPAPYTPVQVRKISNLQTTPTESAKGISDVVIDNSPESSLNVSALRTRTEGAQGVGALELFLEENRFFLKITPAQIGKFLLTLANLFLIALLSIRWKESGHFPLSNLYESLMFLSWSCTTIHLFLIGISSRSTLESNSSLKNEVPSALEGFDSGLVVFKKTKTDNMFFEKLLGAVLAPLALFLNAFATFSLPKEMQVVGPLVPALQSNWLMMHVTVMIISYAALILGSLLSIVFVIVLKFSKNNSSEQLVNQKPQSISSNLDYLSYRIIGIGFPFLTIGILSGAVWANEAWGSYWSWDPKETWALLTWLIFAIYLHTRLTKGWEGEKPALIASFGFIVVWICYLGVNLLGEGLHSYGFFNT